MIHSLYITNDFTQVVTDIAQQFCQQSIQTCVETPVDISIMMDGSGSLGLENFVKNVEYIKEFAQSLTLSENGVHLSVVQYSSVGMETVEVPFTYDINQVVDGMNNAVYQDGFTHTGQGMAWTWNNVLNSYVRAPNKVIIIMTDGKAMDPAVVEDVSNTLKQYARVYAIGIGREVNRADLKNLATDPTTLTPDEDGNYPETVFTANYESLSKLTALVGNAVCSDILS